MSLFGRRERKRIAELEEENRALREDLAVAVVYAGHPGLRQRIEVRKGAWYTVSYRYRHHGGPYLDLADLFVGLEDAPLEYFDGNNASTTHDWKGSPPL